ncbi:ABC transporter ATP-binding protein [Anaerocolumna cellulosilytica]|uniref:ABC transporter ATP-binding protein n=1 Tax=Anaerocolumna cellulosilytica TaxID=433286 RepID=A0A6S6R3I1_9FIRM|nr:ABC transporter ATP-binding protein [Anaerocolumna cellulosilytica]MBB5197255.1 ABC-type multidrug transport system fused ATPase/permease subunit [Anaerocolumna cellulosilytica]BCJ94062.1 ABC transporter ATP-binding protein [Anaerocolumna cellulosilytica]
MSTYRKQFYYKNKLNYFFTILICVLSTALNLSIAFILKLLIDVASGGSMTELKQMTVYSLIYLVILVIIQLLKRKYYNHFIKQAMLQFKNYAFSNLLKKSINSFDNEVTGTYISIFTNDISTIEANYLTATIQITIQVLSFICGIIAMAYLNWFLTLCVLGISLLPILISMVFGKSLEHKVFLASERNESFVSMVKDLLTGFSVVKSFRAEAEILKLYNDGNSKVEHAKNKKRMTGDFITLLSTASSFLVQFTTFVAGAYLAIHNIITAGTVIAFIQLLNYVLEPVGSVGPLLTEKKAASALIDKIEAATSNRIKERDTLNKSSFLREITFHNVSFAYEKEQPILKNINLTFEKGKSYVIVGASGSGKSTLVNLLLGYHNNYEGQITIDDMDLGKLANDSLYDLFSVILQNVFIFDSTIQDNVTMFRSFEQNAIITAMEKSGLSMLIQKKGTEYKCGENGNYLSGGEKQRISIARSLLRKTPILIMDEATSALDQKTAQVIEQEISNFENVTRIVISHRMDEASLRLYDKIIVLNNGRVVETGGFDQLLEQQSYFYSLFQVTKSA